MKPTILIFVALALVPSSFACGQFALESLPKPGQWARYDQTITVAYAAAAHEIKPESSLIIRCLPDVSNSEPACVWIEIEISEDDATRCCYKLLIPESEFGPNGNPMRNRVKGWVWNVSNAETDTSAPATRGNVKPKPISEADVKYLTTLIVVVPPNDAEQLMSDYFDADGQTFRCKGFVFETQRTLSDGEECFYKLETRVSPETPFGLVTAEVSCSMQIDGSEILAGTQRKLLVDSGDDAVSSLPDIK